MFEVKNMKIKEIKVEVKPYQEELDELASKIEKISKGKVVKKEEKIIFNSISDLRKFLTPERIRLIQTIRSKKPKSVYELAKLLNRDRKSVTVDLDILKTIGLVELKKETVKKRITMIPQVNYTRINIAVPV